MFDYSGKLSLVTKERLLITDLKWSSIVIFDVEFAIFAVLIIKKYLVKLNTNISGNVLLIWPSK